MPRLKLSPYDPATALLEQMAALIRGGIDDCATVTPQPAPAWAAGDPAPADHFLLPEGTQLFIDRDFDTVTETPALILNAPEDAKEKSEEVEGAFLIGIEVRVIVKKDFDLAELDSIIDGLTWILTRSVILDDDTRQQPQTRLSTGNLHVCGADWTQNFSELGTSKLMEENAHPMRLLAFKVCCGLMFES